MHHPVWPFGQRASYETKLKVDHVDQELKNFTAFKASHFHVWLQLAHVI